MAIDYEKKIEEFARLYSTDPDISGDGPGCVRKLGYWKGVPSKVSYKLLNDPKVIKAIEKYNIISDHISEDIGAEISIEDLFKKSRKTAAKALETLAEDSPDKFFKLSWEFDKKNTEETNTYGELGITELIKAAETANEEMRSLVKRVKTEIRNTKV